MSMIVHAREGGGLGNVHVDKILGLKKKSAYLPWPHSNRSARIREQPGSNHSQSLMAGHFAAL